nr:glycoside hydrolase family 32 protein [uncultured Bacteroides sp.]
MKNRILSITYILGMSLSMIACNDDNASVADNKNLSETTTFKSVSEPNIYNLYYKPAVGYVGDPMPFYDEASGKQYILYLQDWRDGASTYHPIHCVSTSDASSYTSYGEAIACGTLDEQDPALGTGSTVLKDGTYYTFYTGHKDNATSSQPKEAILLAKSTDLKTWKKDRSFRLDAPSGYTSDDFRDPEVFYDDEAGLYKMLIATKKGGTAIIAQFSSTDLSNWTVNEPFFHNVWGRFYECPDVFKMGNYWYMIYSDKDITRQVQYFYAPTLAELQQRGDAYFPPNEGKLEGTAFYAGKTAGTANERYLYGWCFTRSGEDNAGTGNWAGNLVAHKLVQNSDGTLGLAIPDAVGQKFKTSQPLTERSKTGEVNGSILDGYTLSAGSSVRFSRLGANNKITMKVQAPNNNEAVFGLSFVDCSDQNIKYNIYIEARWKMLKFDKVITDSETGQESRININNNGFTPSSDASYTITVVNEQSACVVYINGQYAFTNRIYNMQYNPWGIFSSDGSVGITDITLSSY